MAASNTTFTGFVHDLVRRKQVSSMELIPTHKKDLSGAFLIYFTEWRDQMGNLYFYTVGKENREYKTSEDKREYQKLWNESLK